MTFGIIGGDCRQTELAALLKGRGEQVYTFALPGTKCCDELERVLQADVVIFPLPLSKGRGEINNTRGLSMPLEKVFSSLRPDQKLFGGQVKETERELAAHLGLQLEDYFLREELTVTNAAITADCAMRLIGMYGEYRRILVLGFGRMGNLLCHRLHRAGKEVAAAARREEVLAWIRGYGYEAVAFEELPERILEFDLVINTVPAPILKPELLERMKCSILDLASRPCVAAEYPRYISARGLPGRMEPKAAATAIWETIHHILLGSGGESV